MKKFVAVRKHAMRAVAVFDFHDVSLSPSGKSAMKERMMNAVEDLAEGPVYIASGKCGHVQWSLEFSQKSDKFYELAELFDDLWVLMEIVPSVDWTEGELSNTIFNREISSESDIANFRGELYKELIYKCPKQNVCNR